MFTPKSVVPKVRTPLTEAELADALARAHVTVLGSEPSYNRLGLMWAQVMGETGRTQAMWNHNFGNIACTQGWPKCHHLTIPKPDVDPSYYRSYDSSDEGAVDFVGLLNRRYGDALEAMDQGDAHEAAKRLRAKGYYTAPLATYALGLKNGFTEFKRRFPKASSSLWRWLLACAAFGGLAAGCIYLGR